MAALETDGYWGVGKWGCCCCSPDHASLSDLPSPLEQGEGEAGRQGVGQAPASLVITPSTPSEGEAEQRALGERVAVNADSLAESSSTQGRGGETVTPAATSSPGMWVSGSGGGAQWGLAANLAISSCNWKICPKTTETNHYFYQLPHNLRKSGAKFEDKYLLKIVTYSERFFRFWIRGLGETEFHG